MLGVCALAHWLAYAGFKAWASDVALRPLAGPERAAANEAIRVAVLAYALALGLGLLAERRFGWRGLSTSTVCGRLLPACVYAAALASYYADAPEAVVSVLSLGVLGTGAASVFSIVLLRWHSALAMRWRQFALALVSLVVSLEVGLRVLLALGDPGSLADLGAGPRLPPAGAEVRLRALLMPSPDPDVVYALKPGLDVRFEGARVATNAFGWREEVYPESKPEGVVRILGIGDSVMFGWGVEAEARYMDRLEAKLASAYPEVAWQTLVSAVPGYNLAMSVAALRGQGMRFAPDLIVYGFVGNDAALPNFLQARPSPLDARSFIAFYMRLVWSRSASLLTTEPEGAAHEGPLYAIQDPALAPPAYRWMLGRPGFESAMRQLEQTAGERPFVVLSFEGARGLLDPAALGPARYLDASGARRAQGPRFTLTAEDPHPSAAGHALLADALFAHLEDAGIARALASRARASNAGEAQPD